MDPVAGLLRLCGDLLYPRRCLVCGQDLGNGDPGPLCATHRREITPVEEPFCERCGTKMFARATGELICNECRRTKRHFDRAFSATIYNDVMRSLVHRYKYRMRQYLHTSLAWWMIEFAHRYIDTQRIEAIIPVPLHWRRFQYRGFNQANALARPLAREFRRPIIKHVLQRRRNTVPQVSLKPKARATNILDAFRVRRPERIEGKHLLVLDDVYTTGATVNECARALKDAGAASVIAFTLTRPL